MQPALRQAAQCPVELCFSYLDDVVIAGRADVVASSLAALQTTAAAAGLVLEPTKCELVAVAGNRSAVDFSLFPAGFAVKGAACDLLGAPIGDSEYCTQATLSDKVQKAGKVLDAGELDNPQVSLQLLRHCASFTKLVHTCAPPPLGSTVQHWWPSMEKCAPASNPLAASQFQTGSGTKRLWALSTGGLAFDNAPFMLLLLTLLLWLPRQKHVEV
jgi:hypothetical protein